MRIVGGEWRGRKLIAPPGQATRPTADRMRQALFDILTHAPWGGRPLLEGAGVLDVFAGTGAIGLEALSRGAASACFIEFDPAALQALRMNITALSAEDRTAVLAIDVVSGNGIGRLQSQRKNGFDDRSRQPRDASNASQLIFLDPPYGQNLIPRAIARLRDADRIQPNAVLVAEMGRDETWMPEQPLLTERRSGAARVIIFRAV